ncbi:helix-turn-helix domain-containing protein [Amycolatopsis keratiniphila]|uniref:Transcriptional regulator n=1 Tax=Amycolatopsis keratiniphila subsp. keratiniphila TaxID=227715 RepID=A0A1W2LHV1_9PSEU|nr:helix-turn-helix transcriptional regulator [Amycolatopsis keratiniphila]ONF62310.1 transcriptional regulator [Amycolatopsis keratiniphila subsp. keratiniphila]
MNDVLPVDASVGARIRHYRDRRGMSRPVLGGLVGKTGEWVKAVENGRLQTPRLPMLLRIAQALELDDLATLTGDGHAVPVSLYAGPRHSALSAVQTALTEYRVSLKLEPVSVPHLAVRLRQAWLVRHSSPDHRTQLGTLLPGLIRDAQVAVRALRGDERREARRVLSGVYQLADFYVAYQPAPELVWMVADRALTEAQEADDPYLIAGGAWAMVQALREAGRWDEAVDLATDARDSLARYLDGAPDDWRGMVGALDAEVAYVHARRGRHGLAWAHWEKADQVARRLGADYRHTQSSFSQSVMSAHAVTLGVELRRTGEALRAANGFDPVAIPSLARRGRHLIEVARAHALEGDGDGVLTLLDRSQRVANETISYNGFARDMLLKLRKRPPTGRESEVRRLCDRVGLAA